jgi:Fe-S cluster biogenesis protein NfuA/nitrite reductase/ring-hydroxylating ferredoxin subunit
MVHPESGGPAESDNLDREAQWRTAGDRIQILLDATSTGGAVARERAEQLVREVVDLYGAALERMLQISVGANPGMEQRFAADDLVASLLLVHGLHPHGVERRIEDALDGVRPYLGSHGGDVTLLDVVDDVVRLQFTGSCKSCPSSAVTLELTVEDAVRAAAPEISSIEVVAAEAAPSASVIPADSLLSRVHANGHGGATGASWHPVPDLYDLAPGEVGGFLVAGRAVLACRIGDELFTYHDRCGSCGGSLAGAALHRPFASAIGEAVLRCPLCRAHFDVVHAGVCVDQSDNNSGADAHLDPIPLLVREGVLSIAVQAEPSGVT